MYYSTHGYWNPNSKTHDYKIWHQTSDELDVTHLDVSEGNKDGNIVCKGKNIE